MEEHAGTQLRAEGGRKTILLVDDDRTSLMRLKTILERRGYRTIAEPEAHAALLLVRNETEHIDLVITDYRMPGMDGLDFSRELKRVSPGTPLILITAHSDVESYLKAINIGVLEYINKPIITQELLKIVTLLLERSRAEGGGRIVTDPCSESDGGAA